MKFLSLVLVLLSCSFSFAASDKIKMYFTNEEILKVIEIYSKASGQKFIVDPAVRGRISIFNQEPVTTEEAFNQLSTSLAVNGFAISKQGDTMVVKTARNIQRDLIEVTSEKPALKPERMHTWIYKLQNVPAAQINRDLRILPSRDGEMNVNVGTNEIIITDWTSNLHRIGDILKAVDKVPDAQTAKLVKMGQDERHARKDMREGKGPKPPMPPVPPTPPTAPTTEQ